MLSIEFATRTNLTLGTSWLHADTDGETLGEGETLLLREREGLGDLEALPDGADPRMDTTPMLRFVLEISLPAVMKRMQKTGRLSAAGGKATVLVAKLPMLGMRVIEIRDADVYGDVGDVTKTTPNGPVRADCF